MDDPDDEPYFIPGVHMMSTKEAIAEGFISYDKPAPQREAGPLRVERVHAALVSTVDLLRKLQQLLDLPFMPKQGLIVMDGFEAINEISGEIERLRAEIERLRAEIERLTAEVETWAGQTNKELDCNECLRAEIERLRIELDRNTKLKLQYWNAWQSVLGQERGNAKDLEGQPVVSFTEIHKGG